MTKTCSVDGCEKRQKANYLCDTHYAFYRRNGFVGERRIKPLAERLWDRVDKTPGLGPNGDCWEWRGYVHKKNGYGYLAKTNILKDGMTSTSRAAYTVSKGEITGGLWVLHKCDNRLCCNPDHLWLGTPKENTQDMIAKGRRRKASQVAKGEAVHQAKLTDEIVLAMRAEPPMTFKAMGAKYGVTAGTACKVILRQTWAHI